MNTTRISPRGWRSRHYSCPVFSTLLAIAPTSTKHPNPTPTPAIPSGIDQSPSANRDCSRNHPPHSAVATQNVTDVTHAQRRNTNPSTVGTARYSRNRTITLPIPLARTACAATHPAATAAASAPSSPLAPVDRMSQNIRRTRTARPRTPFLSHPPAFRTRSPSTRTLPTSRPSHVAPPRTPTTFQFRTTVSAALVTPTPTPPPARYRGTPEILPGTPPRPQFAQHRFPRHSTRKPRTNPAPDRKIPPPMQPFRGTPRTPVVL